MNQPLNLKLRKPKSLPQYTGKDKVEKLILAAQEGLHNHTEAMKKRNTAMILTFAYTGMRREEVANLLINEIDFERNVIIVRDGKGQKKFCIGALMRVEISLVNSKQITTKCF
jgi:integrase/recombinase XerD